MRRKCSLSVCVSCIALSICVFGQESRPASSSATRPATATRPIDAGLMTVTAPPPISDPYFTPTGAVTTASMPRVIIRNMRQDRAGHIWFATFAGPIRYDGTEFRNFADEVGLPGMRIFSLLEDRSGAMWFGSVVGGATRYDGKSFTRFTQADGLAGRGVFWIFEDRDANIWLASDGGVSRFDGKRLTNFTSKDGLVHDSVYGISQDASGRLWFATEGGICSYDGKSFSDLAGQVGKSFYNVRSTVVDRAGNIWFGGQEGAFRYDGKELTTFKTKDGLLDDFVGSMIVDRSGNIWFGHPGNFPASDSGGATRFDGKTFRHFTRKDGLGSATVYCMLEERSGHIWFGSVDAGACRYDGRSFTQFTKMPADPGPATKPVVDAQVETPAPMAPFERLVGGTWRLRPAGGDSPYETWRWGPGRFSMRAASLEVVYWHPARREVRLLSLHPEIPAVGPGSGEGSMKTVGDTLEGTLDLHQPRGVRKLATRWRFLSPDQYRNTLLEDSGAGFQTLAEWDFFRGPGNDPPQSAPASQPAKLPRHLSPFEMLLGTAWASNGEAAGEWAGASPGGAQATFEFQPDYINARIVAQSQGGGPGDSVRPAGDGAPPHLLDAYVYRHVGSGGLRCLALTREGGVFEGDAKPADDGGMHFDLKGWRDEREATYAAQIDFEKRSVLRFRMWSVEREHRILLLEAHLGRLEAAAGK